jgi:hypothetical protein
MEEQVSWIPQHRPAATVSSEMDGLKTQIYWSRTKGCTAVTGRYNRDFCQKYHALSAEHANGIQAAELSKKIMGVKAQLVKSGEAGTALTEADPQAAMLAKIGSLVVAGLKVDDVQMALTIFIALLLEVGSGFGMYVAFSQWRLHDALALPKVASAASVGRAAAAMPLSTQARAPIAVPAIAAAEPRVEQSVPAIAPAAALPASPPAPAALTPPAVTANDNTDRIAQPQRLMAPESDVERFHKEKVEAEEGATITATELYDNYCSWCEEQDKEPLALPTFSREFGELKGIKKAKIAGRVRYIGIAVPGATETAEDTKPPVPIERAALGSLWNKEKGSLRRPFFYWCFFLPRSRTARATGAPSARRLHAPRNCLAVALSPCGLRPQNSFPLPALCGERARVRGGVKCRGLRLPLTPTLTPLTAMGRERSGRGLRRLPSGELQV